MTTKELIEALLEEYSKRKESGEAHYKIKDFYSFFYVNKHFSADEKNKFCAEGIFKALNYFIAKRKSIIEDSQEINFNDLHDLTKEVYPHQVLFQFCAPDAAKKISENEIIQFLNYYNPLAQV